MAIFGEPQCTLRGAGCVDVFEILHLFMMLLWPILTLTLVLMVESTPINPHTLRLHACVGF